MTNYIDDVPDFDFLMSSPACQGHSTASQPRRRRYHEAQRAVAWATIQCLDMKRPEWVFVENVPKFRNWEAYSNWLGSMRAFGYEVEEHILTATNHGVPQLRDRLFVVGRLGSKPNLQFEKATEVPAFMDIMEDTDEGWEPISDACKGDKIRFKAGREKCGRTFLSSGLIDEAKHEAAKLVDNLSPYMEQGLPILGLEPSCVFTIKDELPALLPGEKAKKLSENVQMLDEYLLNEQRLGVLNLEFSQSGAEKILLHGHCHQKAFDSMDATVSLMENAGIEVETIPSSCCGMAGSFGYQSENYQVSMEMAELSLLPRVRKAADGEKIAASGTSCRQQIQHGSGLNAMHPISLLRGRCYV